MIENNSTSEYESELAQELGLMNAIAVAVGAMIGGGIFFKPSCSIFGKCIGINSIREPRIFLKKRELLVHIEQSESNKK